MPTTVAGVSAQPAAAGGALLAATLLCSRATEEAGWEPPLPGGRPARRVAVLLPSRLPPAQHRIGTVTHGGRPCNSSQTRQQSGQVYAELRRGGPYCRLPCGPAGAWRRGRCANISMRLRWERGQHGCGCAQNRADQHRGVTGSCCALQLRAQSQRRPLSSTTTSSRSTCTL